MSAGGNTKTKQAKIDANEYCIKDLAIEHLKEREKCFDKAPRFVDYVYNRCKNDTAPFTDSAGRARKLRLSEIM